MRIVPKNASIEGKSDFLSNEKMILKTGGSEIIKNSRSTINIEQKYPGCTFSREFENKTSEEKYCFCMKRRKRWEQLSDRSLISGIPENIFGKNLIKTNKYTVFNFLPKNLFTQFSKTSNVYFILIGAMQMIRTISISNGVPTIFLPLSSIILISALKDILEDHKRYKSDKEENNRPILIYQNGGFIKDIWENIQVGDIIKIMRDTFFPADIAIIRSSDEKCSKIVLNKINASLKLKISMEKPT